jgi:hypothetical protein
MLKSKHWLHLLLTPINMIAPKTKFTIYIEILIIQHFAFTLLITIN